MLSSRLRFRIALRGAEFAERVQGSIHAAQFTFQPRSFRLQLANDRFRPHLCHTLILPLIAAGATCLPGKDFVEELGFPPGMIP